MPFTPSLFDDLLAPVPRRARAVLRKPAAREAQGWCERMLQASEAGQKKEFQARMVNALLRALSQTGEQDDAGLETSNRAARG